MIKKHNSIVFVIVIILIFALLYMMRESRRPSLISDSQTQVVQASIEDISLSYPEKYAVYNQPRTAYSKTHSTTVWYVNTEENRNFFNGVSSIGREIPTTITLDIYYNPQHLSPSPLLSKDIPYLFVKGEGSPVTLLGKQATLLVWDGLYKGRSIAINHKDFMYVFSVTSITDDDAILSDFTTLLSSVVFK